MAYQNENELVAAVAARAKALADHPIDVVRQIASTSDTGSLYSARQEARGESKGALVEAILLDEFQVEFPRDFSE
jgi:hypothetical protein